MPELWDIYDADRKRTGRTHMREEQMQPGDYHLVVHIWLINSCGEFFIDLRSPDKDPLPNVWETPGGSALAGEDSLTAALREFHEETGIALQPECGNRVLAFRRSSDFCDVWLFRQDIDVNDFVPQLGETVKARFATMQEIQDMMETGIFPPYTYEQQLFDIARRAT